MVSTEDGCRVLVAAIEREPAESSVPGWPWKPMGVAIRVLPLRAVRKLM